MSELDLEKLLGGYATNTLTEAERKALFEAALHDQVLFDALADEQALKELLSDPTARRRILAALEETTVVATASSSAKPNRIGALVEWFQRPPNLALAGGLATAAFAIVLGTRIYQDSLKQVAEPASTEDAVAVVPPQQPPGPIPPSKELSRLDQDRSRDQPVSASSPTTGESALRPSVTPRTSPTREQDKAKNIGPAPASAPVQILKELAASAPASESLSTQTQTAISEERQPVRKQDEPAQESGRAAAKLEAPAAPSLVVPKPAEPVPSAPRPFASALPGKPSASARALFYSQAGEPTAEQEHRSRVGVAQEKSSGAGAMADAPQKEMKRAERSTGLLGKLESTKQSIDRHLGLRYSLIMSGPGGIHMEVDPATPVGKDDVPRLTVETNENGYLYVLYYRQPSGQPATLFPSSGDARVVGRKSVVIALVDIFSVEQTTGQIRLLIFFSRTPQPDVTSRLPANRDFHRLLIEQVDPSQPGAPAEQAVYAVNPDPASAAYVMTEVPLSLR